MSLCNSLLASGLSALVTTHRQCPQKEAEANRSQVKKKKKAKRHEAEANRLSYHANRETLNLDLS